MNNDEFEGKWKQIRGQAREWWGKLTDDDLEQAGGKYEQFIGVLQEKYGYTREAAEADINKRMAEFNAGHESKKEGTERPLHDILEGRWKRMHGQARIWWDKLTDNELDEAAGRAEVIVGLLQEKYGYSRARAESEFKRRVKQFKNEEKNTPTPAAA